LQAGLAEVVAAEVVAAEVVAAEVAVAAVGAAADGRYSGPIQVLRCRYSRSRPLDTLQQHSSTTVY